MQLSTILSKVTVVHFLVTGSKKKPALHYKQLPVRLRRKQLSCYIIIQVLFYKT